MFSVCVVDSVNNDFILYLWVKVFIIHSCYDHEFIQ